MRKFVVEVGERCNKKCPSHSRNCGMGHTDDWISCKETGKELKPWTYKNGFPEWCPLEDS